MLPQPLGHERPSTPSYREETSLIHAKVTLKLALENRLAAFVAGLATAPSRLERYRQDPEAEMAAAGLAEQDREVLRSGDWRQICERMGSDATRPMTLKP